jgi:hypothetical protein
VGANYTFTVTVDGGTSAASADKLSYAPPVINALDGPGAAGATTSGGAVIFLNGSNFGPVDARTVVAAWASPLANDSLTFPGVNCAVVVAHIAIRCGVAPWRTGVATVRVCVRVRGGGGLWGFVGSRGEHFVVSVVASWRGMALSQDGSMRVPPPTHPFPPLPRPRLAAPVFTCT